MSLFFKFYDGQTLIQGRSLAATIIPADQYLDEPLGRWQDLSAHLKAITLPASAD